MEDYIVGRNAVREALRAGRIVQRVLISENQLNVVGDIKSNKHASLKQGAKLPSALSDIIKLAKEKKIEVRYVPEKQLAKYSEGVPHQGVAALVAQVQFQELADVLSRPREEPPLLILTDGIEDPHNLGAIIRTAECAGATAVLIPKRHNAPVTATVAKTSAGAVEFIPLVQVGNVAQTINELKSQGFWVLGAHMDGDRTLYEADLTIPTVLVIGNEGKGLSRLTKERCDFLVTIPMYGQLNSLNASVAASILLYEAIRQRQGK